MSKQPSSLHHLLADLSPRSKSWRRAWIGREILPVAIPDDLRARIAVCLTVEVCGAAERHVDVVRSRRQLRRTCNVACWRLVSHVEYAPRALLRLENKALLFNVRKRRERQADGWTPDRHITLTARRGQRDCRHHHHIDRITRRSTNIEWRSHSPPLVPYWFYTAMLR